MSKLKIPFKSLIRNAAGDDRESLKGKLIYGIFWNLISALASQGFPMIAAIIAARLLGKFGYGQLGMINSTVILFSTFAGLGLGITATKYIAQLHQTDPERTGRIMGLTNLFGLASGVVMCIILFVMAPWLAANTLAAPDLAPALRIASLLLIFNTLVGIQSGSIAGFGAFKDLARIAIFQGIISASLTITGVYFFGLTGAVTAMVINSIINFILYKRTINNLVKRFKISINYMKSWRERDVIWKLSLPSMLSSVMVGPVVWIANVIIINTPGGYGQLGLFNAADQWRTALAFLPGVIGTVLLPMLAANNEENENIEKLNVLISWIVVIIIALPLISFPEIISVLYGNNYYSTGFIEVLALMIFVSCITSYREGISRKLVVKNLMWWGVLDNVLWAFFLIGSVMLLKNLGALGLSLSYIIAYALNTLLFVPFYLWKEVVPRDMIISKEIFLLWAILVVQTILTLLNISNLIKFISLTVSFIVIILIFQYKWNFGNFN
ncbi:oligosaccharide flippase family protein [Methanobacterium congolense]|uniref:Polysaccharide biosynthesis protein n=1 Tax=Methanobacterium congolense TaxID=118062 RepID=A0A1D3L4E3_9EURY|nr:oligosaccharide flippase family protein [Methanobacterium congolense]SCG86389.1 Polysaccharide biosynthesis protein [Methanobacterium congolense]